MNKALGLATLLAALSCLQACGSSEAAEDPLPSAPSVLIHSGHDRSPAGGSLLDLDMAEGSSHRVIESQAVYEQMLRLYSREIPATVDFAQTKVLLVDMGTRNSGGHAVEVTGVTDHTYHVVAHVLFKRAGKGCATADAMTNPFQFVQISTTKEVLVQETLQVENCV
jgi:hypothetical protein